MKSIYIRWALGGILKLLCAEFAPVSLAFQQPRILSKVRRCAPQKVVLDPNDITSAVSQASNHDIPALLSTMLTSTLEPPRGFSIPFFGPQDPYLAAGKSIAPSAEALLEMGITPPAKTAAEILPNQSPAVQEYLQSAMANGWKVLDSSRFLNTPGNTATQLPGFAETRGILPSHDPTIPPPGPAMFVNDIQWVDKFINVLDKLPSAAFYYVLLEFFIIRPGLDIYKEDIKDDPRGVFAETIAVTGVRLAAFLVIGLLAVVIFG